MKAYTVTGVFCLGVIVFAFLGQVFNEHWPTPFLWAFPVLPLFLSFLLWAIIYAGIRWKRTRWRAWIPLLMLIVTFLLIPQVVEFYQYINFHYHLSAREQVIALLEKTEGSLQDELFILPEDLQATSKGGKVWVLQKLPTLQVFFWTDPGLLDACGGFVYSEDGNPITSLQMNAETIKLVRYDQHWYWVGTS